MPLAAPCAARPTPLLCVMSPKSRCKKVRRGVPEAGAADVAGERLWQRDAQPGPPHVQDHALQRRLVRPPAGDQHDVAGRQRVLRQLCVALSGAEADDGVAEDGARGARAQVKQRQARCLPSTGSLGVSARAPPPSGACTQPAVPCVQERSWELRFVLVRRSGSGLHSLAGVAYRQPEASVTTVPRPACMRSTLAICPRRGTSTLTASGAGGSA